ncbi:hypothetical protein ADUPG1_008887 [Aduncisulcus paluster]|uniref:Uncharacterized protein n=1 Tax=Aduncisulcus paluster TaxID=2918883 RepID=A0ABQ5KVV1_9EUKA|nr:hypothetical protein ADUPG1_008887 [Aduncisulcus paluster]
MTAQERNTFTKFSPWEKLEEDGFVFDLMPEVVRQYNLSAPSDMPRIISITPYEKRTKDIGQDEVVINLECTILKLPDISETALLTFRYNYEEKSISRIAIIPIDM